MVVLPYSLDGEVVQLRHGLRAAVQIDVVLELSDLRGPGGQNQVLGADGVDHIHRRQALGLQGIGVEIHLHLPLFAAVGKGMAAPGMVTRRVRIKFTP